MIRIIPSRKKQLEDLAKINGVHFDRQVQPRTWRSANVYCKYCSDLSHPTSDCPLKNKPVDKAAIEQEYEKFMKDLGIHSDLVQKDATKIEKDYESFMSSIYSLPPARPTGEAPQPTQYLPPPPHLTVHSYLAPPPFFRSRPPPPTTSVTFPTTSHHPGYSSIYGACPPPFHHSFNHPPLSSTTSPFSHYSHDQRPIW